MSHGDMTQNSATSGGGVYVQHGRLTLTDELIKDNSASDGGGLYNSGGTATVVSGSMQGNSAGHNGGGIYANGGSLTLNNVILNNNDADVDGGGLYSYGGTVIVNGGSFTDNSALNNGAGICNDNKGILTLQNGVTFTANKNAQEGGGLYLAIGSTTTFGGCTVKGNFATTGVGVYQQTNAQGTTAKVINLPGLTDNDDPGGVPFKGS